MTKKEDHMSEIENINYYQFEMTVTFPYLKQSNYYTRFSALHSYGAYSGSWRDSSLRRFLVSSHHHS